MAYIVLGVERTVPRVSQGHKIEHRFNESPLLSPVTKSPEAFVIDVLRKLLNNKGEVGKAIHAGLPMSEEAIGLMLLDTIVECDNDWRKFFNMICVKFGILTLYVFSEKDGVTHLTYNRIKGESRGVISLTLIG